MVDNHQQDDSSERRFISRRTYLRAGLATVGIAAAPATFDNGDGVARAAPSPVADPAPDDSPIGGGSQYERKVSGGNYTATTKNELLDRLDHASAGDTVYIPNDVSIDLGSTKNIGISSGVTLASGRGINGAAGGRLYTEDIAENDEPVFEVRGDEVRITGLRIQGPRADYFNPGDCQGQTGLECRDSDAMSKNATLGFFILGSNVEIDNCQLYGWPQAPIMSGAGGYAVDTHIHHNSLHNNQMEGFGYGVVVTVGNPTIEWNYFDKNRHSIAGTGKPDCSYEARYNLVGPNTVSHAFDMHGEETGNVMDGKQAGRTISIHHNTFQFSKSYVYDVGQEAVTIRGVPSDKAVLENNWFYHTLPDGQTQPDDTNVDENGQPFRQYNIPQDDWTNVEFANNHYGTDEPASDIGHPRSDDGALTAEVGTVSQDADTWQHVTLDNEYSNPVVVMKPVSQTNGENPCHARVKNVTGSSFEYKIEEWEYTPDGHRPETISYLVLEQGSGSTDDGTVIEAGTVTTDEALTEHTFESTFDTKPVVFTQTQTVNESSAVVTRNTHVDTVDFEVRLQEQAANPNAHSDEVTAYIAIEPGRTTLNGTEVEVGHHSSVTDDWMQLGFDGSYSSPAFVADMQTINDGDTATLRYKDLDADGVAVQVEEEQSDDDETDHRGETVGYFVTSRDGAL
ncbi:hypothetical protein [Halogeometricum borinquense]|uniref:hypothetical protein n=1 Tax=Halogeometricum borinquense TaxID=60847 RepID=UPI00344A9CF1